MITIKNLDLLDLLDDFNRNDLIDEIVIKFNKSKFLCLKNFTPLDVKFGFDSNFEYKRYLIGELFNINNFSIKKHSINNFYSFTYEDSVKRINFVIDKKNFELFLLDENELFLLNENDKVITF